MESKREREHLEHLAESVADETPVDWDEASTTASPGLKAIAAIAAAYRTSGVEYDSGHRPLTATPDEASHEAILFRWGHLDVIEHVGSGTAGDVYRARDTKLDRDVALKLSKLATGDPSGDESRRYLQEARGLAKVRHENVLTVHGADVVDGNVGLWSELVRGRTLEERLAEEGRCGAREATLLGLDLCRALAAIHEAGLVHGDVKASNVMRAEGGRTILLDFSSGRELGVAREGSIGPTGTPLALPPEVLEGQAPTESTDLYSLGALLYRLVSGRYPVVANTFAELQAKHAQGERTPLRDLRPDLPRTFIDLVERALAPAPSRYASAGEMEAALAASLEAAPAVRVMETRRRFPLWAIAAGLGFIVFLAAILRGGFGTPSPDFRVDATLFRSDDRGDHSLARGGEVWVGDQLFLEIEGNQPMHVYVLDEDESGNMYVLFPVAGLELQNPLPPAVRHRLPGVLGGVSQDWQVTSADGRETILVVSSREPLPPLEKEIAQIPAASPQGVEFAYAELDPLVLEGLRGVAGMTPSRSQPENGPGRLAELAADFRKQARSADDLWLREFGLKSRAE